MKPKQAKDMNFVALAFVGDRVVFKRDVDRFPDFIVPKGTTGIVVATPDKSNQNYAVKMDTVIDGAEEWGNECWWHKDLSNDPADDLELL